MSALKKPHEVGQDAAALSARPCAELPEFEYHLWDTERQFKAAYQRFEQWGLAVDRDEALLFLHLQNEALRNRPHQVERHAAFERMLDEGCDYFQAQARADRLEMERRAA